MSDFRADLRAATRAWHDRVDAGFSHFNLAQRDNYAAFLLAHARALLPLEAWIVPDCLIPGWVGRSDALESDLVALGLPLPQPLALDLPCDDATRWGAMYVVEGSRLGATTLTQDVPAVFPTNYLNARHAPGGWRGLLAGLETQAASGGAPWKAAAHAGAVHAFTLFDLAAREASPVHS